jgi:hypothetical protein
MALSRRGIRPLRSWIRLNAEINAGLADPTMRTRLADLGGVPMAVTPGQFGKFIADETEKWAKVVKFSGAKAD